MNFVFISPMFPVTYWNFCDRLKKNGVNVLGIGDVSYDALSNELKGCLTEYYKVNNLENYDEVFRACAFFSFKYGKIDFIESNNEYWLEQDAMLRTDFNVNSGAKIYEMDKNKSKFTMKEYYTKAGVPSPRCHRVSSLEDLQAFVKTIGYPAFAKPENGVGASGTYKLNSDEEVVNFFNEVKGHAYVVEEFVTGDIYSYDAVIDSNGEPTFESMTAWPPSIADIVEQQLELTYYVPAGMDEKLQKVGRATVKSFGVKSRFVHFEYFKLRDDKEGLGKKGDFVGLEVNMRPAGGYTPDMMNFAHSVDVYEIWAEMIAHDTRYMYPDVPDSYCVYASRRDIYNYKHSHEDILNTYNGQIRMMDRIADVLAGAMGNQMYLAHVNNEEEAQAFIQYVTEKY